MSTEKKINIGVLWLFLGSLCASTTGLTQAFTPESATPLSIGGVRLLSGGFFLLLLGLITKKLPNFKTIPKKPVIWATLSLILYQLCFFVVCKKIGVAVGSVVAIGSVPIVVGFFAWLLLKEKPTKIWYIATFFMLVGLVALGLSNAGDNLNFNIFGIVLAVIAGCGYGLFLVFIKPALEGNGSVEIMIIVFILGGILMLPIVFSQPMDWIFTIRGMLCILNWGGITAALAFFLILYGMKTTPVNVAGALSITEPFCAALWGILILNEQVGFQGYVGLSLILSSSILLVIPQKT